MSRKVAARAKKKFQTRTIEVDVVGGSEDYCAESFEFRNENGVLLTTYNSSVYFKDNSTVTASICSYMPEIETVALVDGNGNVCLLDWYGRILGKTEVQHGCTPIVYHRIIDGEYKCVFIGGSEVTYLPDIERSQLSYSPLCGVMHDGRLFMCEVGDEYRIRWSSAGFDETDESCWDESIDGAGTLRLDFEGGPVLWMHSLGRDIIMVRKHGVTVLHAGVEPRLFTLDKTRLFRNEIGMQGSVVCNGKVYFCTDYELYSFDGSSLKIVELEKFMQNYTLYGVMGSYNQYIYMRCYRNGKFDFCEYNVLTGKSTLFARGANAVWRMHGAMVGVFGTYIKNIEYNKPSTERLWKSKPIDLGLGNVKTLKRIVVDCDRNIEVTVTNDAGLIYSTDGRGAFRPCLPGTEFTFSITGEGVVRKITAEWEVRE